jgi:ABC-type transport system involved in multi-copper enzyme maturation permease subunit
MNMQRVWAIASNVFREVFRERVLYLTVLFAIADVLAVSFLNEVSAGTETKISLDVGIAGIGLIGLTVAAFVGGGLVNKEIEKRTALILIAKPISRAEFILGKHLGLSSVIAVLMATMTVIYFTVLGWRQISFPAGSLMVSISYIGLEMILLSGVAILFGVFSSSLMSTLLTIAVYFMGHFSQNLVELSRTVKTPSIQLTIQGIYLLFPDLSRLDLKNQAVYGILPEASTLLTNALYGLIYTGLVLAISTTIFAKREF